jgi:hypothetical protein
VIGADDRLGVVLHDDHGVAGVAQPLQCREEAGVVALVQADGGLVEHVHDARQAGTDLAREPDALRFPAGERIRGPVEGQVVEADVIEKSEPRADLPHDPFRDRQPRAGKLDRLEELRGLGEGQRRKLVDRPARHGHVPCFAPQPRAVALGAGMSVQVLGQLLLDDDGVRFPVAALQVGNDALERVLAHVRLPALSRVREPDLPGPGAVQYHFLRFRRQLAERALEIEAVMLRQRLQHLEVELVAPVPALDRAGGERQLGKGYDALRIEEAHRAQTVAARARAHRVVEGEEARLELRKRVAAHRAREFRGEEMLDPFLSARAVTYFPFPSGRGVRGEGSPAFFHHLRRDYPAVGVA